MKKSQRDESAHTSGPEFAIVIAAILLALTIWTMGRWDLITKALG